MKSKLRFKVGLALTGISFCSLTYGQDKKPADLSNMPLEDLIKIQVTTASKKAQSFFDVPAAIYVITQQDIQRSGARSIPDLLRSVPGMQVNQNGAYSFPISARGFASGISDKMLVLVDGRSVYSPDYSGTYWDSLDLVLEDIDRIEVIRGPGGTLWGANAVNGIINIISKNAADTQGLLASTGAGGNDKTIDVLRYGNHFGKNGSYRVYGKVASYSALDDGFGGSSSDPWNNYRMGMRADWGDAEHDSFSFMFDHYNERLATVDFRPVLGPPFWDISNKVFSVFGSSMIARWNHKASANSSSTLQLNYDDGQRLDPFLAQKLKNFDVDYQNQSTSSKNALTWGLGYRVYKDEMDVGRIQFTPPKKTLHIISCFAQLESQLSPKLKSSIGTKLERNDYTGWEIQPSVKFTYKPNEKNVGWASIARAVRTPSRFDRESSLVGFTFPLDETTIGIWDQNGNPDYKSEILLAYELGWRTQPNDRTFIDVAAFYNRYSRLRTLEQGEPFDTPDGTVFPNFFGNKASGQTVGVETTVRYDASDHWRLTASGTVYSPKFRLDKDSTDPFGNYSTNGGGAAPRYQFTAASYFSASKTLDIDMMLYYYDRGIASFNPPNTRIDLRIGWKPSEHFQLSLSRHDITNAGPAFSGAGGVETRFKNWFLNATWKF